MAGDETELCQATRRKTSSRLSQSPVWFQLRLSHSPMRFQLANVRLTNLRSPES
jgi:hypothetical protein